MSTRRIAYLVNQYPKTSHAWMRREIQGVLGEGLKIDRYSLRRVGEPLVDPGDIEEEKHTRFLLEAGAAALLLATLATLFTKPVAFFKALRLTWFIGFRHPRGRLYHLAYLVEACLFAKWMRQTPADHVHAHFGTNAATVACLANLLGAPPYSFTFHGPEIFEAISHHGLREKLHRASFAIAISYHGMSMLKRWSDYEHWNKLHLIHCGTDAAFLDEPVSPVPGTGRMVCVARLSPVKGHLVLLDATARLVGEGLDPRLAFVGGGDFEDEIKRVAKQLNIEDRLEFLGWKSGAEVKAEVLASRAMVLPSFDEGLPVVFMESYALHRPILSTYIAGIPELIENGKCGWVVPAGSVDALTDAMRECLTMTTTELAAYGAEGARRVHEAHDSLKESAKLARLFKDPSLHRSA